MMEPKDITAICAAIIALAALGVSVWTGFQNRRHNRLSVRPRLRIDRFTYLKSPVRVAVVNNGTGPAIIRNFSLTVDGTPAASDDVPLAVAAARRLDITGPFDSYTPFAGDTLRAGESKDLLMIRDFPDEIEKRKELRKKLLRVEFRISYESIYGEAFSLQSTKA